MKKFNVLDRNLILHQNYLLQASAGTGKTFSIQNLVVRLLIEAQSGKEPFLLQRILVVTFTRAATRDLKQRIRCNIEQALEYLQKWEKDHCILDEAPDYLKACMEKGEIVVRAARKHLQQAIFTFDQAQIFTIHSFCARVLRQFALESDMGLHFSGGENPLSQSEIMTIIRDFFRTKVSLENYSPGQLENYLKLDPEQKKLSKLIQSGYEFPLYPAFREVCEKISKKLLTLKIQFSLTSEKMIQDFQAQAGAYRNYKSGETKAATLEKIVRFAKLFDQNEWESKDIDVLIEDGLVWVKALDPNLLKGKSALPLLHYPELTRHLREDLDEWIEESRDSAVILARMAKDCQSLLRRYQKEEEKFSPDDMLRKMNESLKESFFLKKVLMNYDAVIIDEFQDTDPLQWQIFKNLFLSEKHPWSGFLYLVGDPKQSIYSFRQADIYTYLEAAKTLGEDHCFSLNVSYRSQPQLVHALNLLFSNKHLPHFIPLPKTSSFLIHPPVEAAKTHQNFNFNDERGAVHFFIAECNQFQKPKLTDLETSVFFPFIVQEILRLRKQKDLSFHHFAILVRDRHQALRLGDFLDRFGIPYLNQRGSSLAGSIAHQSAIDLLQAILKPHDRGILRKFLGSPLMGWTHEEIKKEGALEFALLFVQRLKSSLFEQGFAQFFQEILQTTCKDDGSTVSEQILNRKNGRELYRDLQQIADLIIDHQFTEWNTPEGIISFLDQFYIWEENDDARVKRFQDPRAEGIKIITLHYCKGLEFEVVFALGLINRMGSKESLIPTECEGRQFLTPKIDESEEHLSFCEENDAEKMRQLYVGLTRAKLQLYIPVALSLPSEKIQWGEASPMDLFLAHFGQKSVKTYSEIYAQIRQEDGKKFVRFLETEGSENHMTYSIHQEIESSFLIENEKRTLPLLQKPDKVRISVKPMWMTSFSTLFRQRETRAEEKLSHKGAAPQDYHCEAKNVHTLPANRETGILIHAILEKLSFKEFINFNHEQKINALRPFVQKSILKDWEDTIVEWISNVLKTPLMGHHDFCLGDLDPTQIFREMPFVFPFLRDEHIEELDFKEGMIKGIIDMLFCYKDRYYLLDWKTNWLGPHLEAYQSESLQHAMCEHGYFLQASIYTEAVKRFLKCVERRPFDECFGGYFYLFLRGIHPEMKSGIYYSLEKGEEF